MESRVSSSFTDLLLKHCISCLRDEEIKRGGIGKLH